VMRFVILPAAVKSRRFFCLNFFHFNITQTPPSKVIIM
jgi:hypothetical protein